MSESFTVSRKVPLSLSHPTPPRQQPTPHLFFTAPVLGPVPSAAPEPSTRPHPSLLKGPFRDLSPFLRNSSHGRWQWGQRNGSAPSASCGRSRTSWFCSTRERCARAEQTAQQGRQS